MEETAAEGLRKLRAENSSYEQLLLSSDVQLPACKNELLASRAAGSAAPDSERQLLGDSSVLPLDRDDVLVEVFSYVGGGDHLYVSGVCRRWRDRYMQYCVHNSTSELDDKLVTRQHSVLTTENRLQLALSSGLTVADWTFDKRVCAQALCHYSLEPEKVMMLLRVHHDVPWSTMLWNIAAFYNKLALLQWLHAHLCPWEEAALMSFAIAGGSIAVLEWLSTIVYAPWTPSVKIAVLKVAACEGQLDVVQWIRAHGADWPSSFYVRGNAAAGKPSRCWNVSVVQWALAHGLGWLCWKCEDYTADKYESDKYKQQATELFEWAHANGCPCTCGYIV
jgi:hypothetical protein